MPEYRIYSLKIGTNHIMGPPVLIECASEKEAIAKAKMMIADHLDVEVWLGVRCVTRLRPADV